MAIRAARWMPTAYSHRETRATATTARRRTAVPDTCAPRAELDMSHRIDWTRALLLALLLGAGMYVAARLVRPELPGNPEAEPRRWARRGMWSMTLLGVM